MADWLIAGFAVAAAICFVVLALRAKHVKGNG